MEVSLVSLRYFQKTAQLQHLSNAAEQLHIAQPALSRSIHALEEDLGVRLFDRLGRNIVLNDAGQILLKYTDRIFMLLQDAERELEEHQKRKSITVTLSLYAASKIIPPLLTAFQMEHPDVRFCILQQTSSDPSNSNADISLFSSITPIENGHAVTLLEEEIFLAMPESDPRAAANEVTLTDFIDTGFISLQQGKSLRTITDVYCQMVGFTPQISMECDSPSTVREFIRAGLGVSFVPCITWHGVAAEKIALRPIAFPRCVRYIGLSWKEHSYLTQSAMDLRDFLIENFAKFAHSTTTSSSAFWEQRTSSRA